MCIEKATTAVDFADITELAEEGERERLRQGEAERDEGEGEREERRGGGSQESSPDDEAMVQKGIEFAQTQLTGKCVCVSECVSVSISVY